MPGSDSLYEILDDRFIPVAAPTATSGWSVLHDDCRWAEGPLYLPAWRQLIWSDIPNDRMLRWDEATGAVGVFRAPAGNINGNTLDRAGPPDQLRAGQPPRHPHRARRHASPCSPTASTGKRLNSPNDAVVRSDGSIWFSDPDFGIISDYEGFRAESEIGACNVYRIDPATGEVRLVADGFARSNGLVFSPDERQLYVSDTRAGQIRAFDVRDDGTLSDGKVFAEAGERRPLRQHPLRQRGPAVGGRHGRRRALLRPGRHADRPPARPRGGVQHHLRRPEEQPPVHHSHHVAVLPGDVGDRGAEGVAVVGPVRVVVASV